METKTSINGDMILKIKPGRIVNSFNLSIELKMTAQAAGLKTIWMGGHLEHTDDCKIRRKGIHVTPHLCVHQPLTFESFVGLENT